MITLRASSLPELFDCPARWEAKHVRGLRLPSSGVSQLGKAVHASTAVFDVAALRGNPVTADEAAGAAVDTIHKPKGEVAWDDELRPATAEKIALGLHGRYCAEIAPTQHYLGVEVPCDRLEISDLGIALTGTTDRVRATDKGEIGVVDIKTGSTAVAADGTVKTGAHMAQLAVYELLASQAIGQPMTAPAQIVGMQTGKTEKAQRVACADVQGASLALVGDDFAPGILEIAAKLLHSGVFYGNPRSQLCSAKYCPAYGACRFRG